MNGVVLRFNRDTGEGASGSGVTGGTGSRHGNRKAVIGAIGEAMDGQPIAAMASITVPGAGGGKAYQHPAASLVMTEVAAAMMG